MIVVALTGGIGSGKSAVAAMLAAMGAVVIDADRLARQVVEPGEPAYEAVVKRFGEGVLAADGSIDRAGLASLVFNDPAALRDLNGIVHPAVGEAIAERIAELAGEDRVVVLEIPLLVESGGRARYPVAGVLVVDAPPEVALARLVAEREMSETDALARMAAQSTR